MLTKLYITLYYGKKDANELAKFITDVDVSEMSDKKLKRKKTTSDRPGGLKGDKARPIKLPADKRTEIAKKATKKRWGDAK